MKLTETEYGTIDNALMCAAERYREHVALLLQQPEHHRLADQFERQATEADALRQRLAEREPDEDDPIARTLRSDIDAFIRMLANRSYLEASSCAADIVDTARGLYRRVARKA